MKILLKKDYPQLGFTGETVDVSNGFARNFLLPQDIAVEINKRNEKFYKNLFAEINAKQKAEKAAADEKGDKLAKLNLQTELKLGGQGKSFGSISAKDIYTLLTEKGIELSPSQVKLAEPIKFAGVHEFEVKLHSDVVKKCEIKVIADASALKKASEASNQNFEESAPADSSAEEAQA